VGNCLIIRFWDDNWILNVGHLRNHCVQPLINVDSYVRVKGNTLMPSFWNFSLLTSKLPPHICDITKTIPASGDDNFHDVLAWLAQKMAPFSLTSAYGYLILHTRNPPSDVVSFGSGEGRRRILFFPRCIAYKSLLTYDYEIDRRGLIQTNVCPICNRAPSVSFSCYL